MRRVRKCGVNLAVGSKGDILRGRESFPGQAALEQFREITTALGEAELKIDKT